QAQLQEVYSEHFHNLGKIISEKAILPADIWNFDECGFRIGIGGSHDVLTMETFKVAQSPSETNRDFMSMVEAINAAGETIPPLTILKGAQILHQHVSREL